MSRRYSASEVKNRTTAKRQFALDRVELRQSEAREAPAGATSFPVKVQDPATRAMIDAAIARRNAGSA